MTESLDRRMHADLMFEQRFEQMASLPGQILFALACNEAAEGRWRKAAVELLIDKKFPQANAREVENFVREITADRAAKSDVQDMVESAIEEPLEEQVPTPGSGLSEVEEQAAFAEFTLNDQQ